MTRLISQETYEMLFQKAYLYDTQLQPVIDSFHKQQAFLYVVILILLGLTIAGFCLALYYRGQSKYYKEVLKQNVGGW